MFEFHRPVLFFKNCSNVFHRIILCCFSWFINQTILRHLVRAEQTIHGRCGKEHWHLVSFS